MTVLDTRSIALDSSGRLSYTAALILRDLYGRRHGKCPCHVVGSTAVPQRLAYEFFSEMLARGWVEFQVEEDCTPANDLLLDVKRRLAAASEEDRINVWQRFLRHLPDCSRSSRYHLQLSRLGERVLRRDGL